MCWFTETPHKSLLLQLLLGNPLTRSRLDKTLRTNIAVQVFCKASKLPFLLSFGKLIRVPGDSTSFINSMRQSRKKEIYDLNFTKRVSNSMSRLEMHFREEVQD